MLSGSRGAENDRVPATRLQNSSVEVLQGCRASNRAPPRTNASGYAKFRSRSHDAVIHVYDDAGNVIETHEHKGEFKEFCPAPQFPSGSLSA
jgi:hypothetical protein